MKKVTNLLAIVMIIVVGVVSMNYVQINAASDHTHSYVALGMTDGIVTKECTICGRVIEQNVPNKVNVLVGSTPAEYRSTFPTTYLAGKKMYWSVTPLSPSNSCRDMEFIVEDPSIISCKQTDSNQAEFTMLKPGVTDITVCSKWNPDACATYTFTVHRAEINGFQISATAEGFRTNYTIGSANDDVIRAGLVYALADYIDCTKYGEMFVENAEVNEYVYCYEATENGKLQNSLYDSENSTSYAMTMKFGNCSSDFFVSEILVRCFIQLKDGSYVYGDIEKCTVFNIAETLYFNNWMNNEYSHNYLYTNILSKVDKDYLKVDFIAGSGLVTP